MKIRPFGLRITARAEVPELLRDTRPFPIAWRRALPEETGPGFTYPLFPDPSPGRPGPPPKEGRKPLPPERPGADPDPTPPPDESGDDEGTVPGDAPLEPVPGDSRRYKDIPAGPYDPRRPLPWDKYEYPATPPPPRMPLAQRLEKKAAEYYLKWWRGLPDEEGELPELPPGETRPVLPSRGISSRASGLAGSFGLTRADVPTDQVWRELNDTKAVTFREHITSWVKKLYGPSPLELLDQYLRAAGIRHFSAKELTIHKWDGVRAARKTTPPNAWRQYRGKTFDGAAWSFVLDTFGADLFPKTALLLMPRYIVPPPEMWPRIIPALRILDRFREYLGQPVRGISGYRHPAYNTMIQGSEDSFHMSFSAVDFTYRIRLPDDRIDTSVFFNWFNHLYRARGDGTGAYRSFVHLDVGHSRHLIKGKSQQWRRPKDLDDVVPLPPRFR